MLRVCLAIVAFSAAPAIAQTSSSPAPAKDAEKRICKADVPTGSIMAGKKTCLTRAQWNQVDGKNRYHVDHYRDASGKPAIQWNERGAYGPQ